MILTGPEIQRQVNADRITIDPFEPKHINPASYDLTLGDKVGWVRARRGTGFSFVYDIRRPVGMYYETIGEDGFVLQPEEGYLMHTRERVRTDHYVPVLDGKSSLGRLFVSVHQTAGYGDPGFDGQYTLEVTTVYPVRIYAGMRIAQMRFHMLFGEVALYKGNYQGEGAIGPVASRAHKQFEEP